ncbi:MAG: shikimate dehydrogenase family protein, partial [bacterium]
PYKEEIRSYLDSLSPEAEWIGAVNTIEFQPNGRLRGHNTDWAGFRQALLEAFSLPDAFHALVLGSGGASKAVQYALHQLPGCRGITLVSRSTPLGAGANHLAYTDLDSGLIRAHTLIINTTPLGMHPDVGSRPPIPYQVLTGHHLLMDLVYNPADTAFMQAGASQGAQVQNGLRMLELQAEAAWQIWQQNPHI